MRLAVGILVGFWCGLLGSAILFVKTDRVLETGTFNRLRVCVLERDRIEADNRRLIEDVGAYQRAIKQIAR
jgi:hypothetical protein